MANVAHDAWRWCNVQAKSDRLDAEKLAEFSQVGQLPLVHVPERPTRHLGRSAGRSPPRNGAMG